MTEINAIKLFNPEGDDSLENQQLLGGNPTGISNLNENKYAWANALYRKMIGNHWIPEKVKMVNDKVSIKKLSAKEMDTLENNLSFLIFLDSYQCLNLPNIKKYLTSVPVRNLISLQEQQEAIHSQSYQYMLDSLFPLTTREAIYNKWRTNPHLKRRIDFVVEVGEAFEKVPSLENFKKVVAMNFILEAIYFYQGFMFFDQLASRQLLTDSSVMIDYIRRDEITHIAIFAHIMKEIYDENDYQMLNEMIMVATNHEIEWGKYLYSGIMGITDDSTEKYMKYLANHRTNMFKLDIPYPNEGFEDPYKHLSSLKRGNYFEAAAIVDYDTADTVPGWDDF